jgi:hypothetical protein
MQEVRQSERRRTRRVRMGQSLRVRPSDPKDVPIDEIGTTKNVSRDGVYFVTQRESYYLGMRLFVTLPYHSPVNPLNHEYIGQVARVDDLGEGQHGVAVQLLSSADRNPTGGSGRMK